MWTDIHGLFERRDARLMPQAMLQQQRGIRGGRDNRSGDKLRNVINARHLIGVHLQMDLDTGVAGLERRGGNVELEIVAPNLRGERRVVQLRQHLHRNRRRSARRTHKKHFLLKADAPHAAFEHARLHHPRECVDVLKQRLGKGVSLPRWLQARHLGSPRVWPLASQRMCDAL